MLLNAMNTKKLSIVTWYRENKFDFKKRKRRQGYLSVICKPNIFIIVRFYDRAPRIARRKLDFSISRERKHLAGSGRIFTSQQRDGSFYTYNNKEFVSLLGESNHGSVV